MKTKKQKIDRVWKLLDSPEKWTQGEEAKNEREIPCPPESRRAVCWCVWGGLQKVYGFSEAQSLYRSVEDVIRKKSKFEGLTDWNDYPRRTWEQVYNILKKLDI